MSLFKEFTNLYSLQKTLRFALKPIGKTAEHIQKHGLLSQDEQRAEDYKQAKKIIDEYHKWFIEQRLKSFQFLEEDLKKFEETYYKLQKSKTDDALQKKLKTLQDRLRKKVAKCFQGVDKWLFKNTFYQKTLVDWLKDNQITIEGIDDPVQFIQKFAKWTTYFNGFKENRRNIYKSEEKATAISYRIVHENLPKFLDNCKRYTRAKKLDVDFGKVAKDLQIDNLDHIFDLNHFNQCLTQSSIDQFNEVIGGKSLEDGKKLQGVNEAINLFSQQIEHQKAQADDDKKKDLDKKRKDVRACKMQVLFKQILSDREGSSFRPEGILDDAELCQLIQDFSSITDQNDTGSVLKDLKKTLETLKEADPSQLYLKNDRCITDISQALFGNYSIIEDALNYYVEKSIYPTKGKLTKNLEKQRDKWLKKSYFSFEEIHGALKLFFEQYQDEELENHTQGNEGVTKEMKAFAIQQPLLSYFLALNVENKNLLDNISEADQEVSKVLEKYQDSHKQEMKSETDDIQKVKNYLDAVSSLQRFLKPLYVKLKKQEEDKQSEALEQDTSFYSDFDKMYEALEKVIPLYNQTRNYLTQKAFRTGKYKLNFNMPNLLGGL